MNEAVQKMMKDVKDIKADGEFEPKGEPEQKGDKSGLGKATDDAGQQAEGRVGTTGEAQEDESGQPKASERQQREESKALNSGWKPPDQWDGEESDFVNAREWNRTVALLRRIDREREERTRLEEEVGSFGDRLKNVMEVTKQKTIQELETKRREAIDDSDHREVERIDKEIKETEKELEFEEPKDKVPDIRPEVEDWMSDNEWFDKDQDMTRFALAFQRAQLEGLSDPVNPTGRELEQSLKKTTRAIRNEFPEHFQKKRQPVAPTLERKQGRASKSRFTYNDLTEQERKVLENIERLPGGMSRDEYIKAIADMRETT